MNKEQVARSTSFEMTTAIESDMQNKQPLQAAPAKEKKNKRINERMFNMDGIDWHMAASSQLLVD